MDVYVLEVYNRDDDDAYNKYFSNLEDVVAFVKSYIKEDSEVYGSRKWEFYHHQFRNAWFAVLCDEDPGVFLNCWIENIS
jgi:hypothetical protein